MDIKLPFNVGDHIEYQENNDGRIGNKTKEGVVTQITDKLVAIDGPRYPDSFHIQDLETGKIALISPVFNLPEPEPELTENKPKEDETMPTKYDWETILTEHEEDIVSGKSLESIAKELGQKDSRALWHAINKGKTKAAERIRKRLEEKKAGADKANDQMQNSEEINCSPASPEPENYGEQTQVNKEEVPTPVRRVDGTIDWNVMWPIVEPMLEDMTMAQISEATGISFKSLKNKIQRMQGGKRPPGVDHVIQTLKVKWIDDIVKSKLPVENKLELISQIANDSDIPMGSEVTA